MSEYIDRQSLINHLNQSAAEYYSRAVERVIELEPAADVKPFLRAEWIPYKGGTVCGRCAKGLKRTYGPNDVFMDLSEMPYCPNCGAKMEVTNDN